MSRIGKVPVEIPDGVEVTIVDIETPRGKAQKVTVKGAQGELVRTFRPEVTIVQEGKTLLVTTKGASRTERSLFGLSRTLLNNMVIGVHTGFKKQLEIIGVGYRAALKGTDLDFQLGLSHPCLIKPPAGIKFEMGEGNTQVIVSGPDKELVGQVSANIRALRAPEPYKGKGIKYSDERIRRKAGKSGAK